MSQITIWSFHLHYVIISRRSRQRERLSASVLSICSSVCLFACLSVCLQKNAIFSKLSNLELWCLLATYRKLCKLNWAFQRTHYWIPTIQDGWDPPSWKSTWRHFFLPKDIFNFHFRGHLPPKSDIEIRSNRHLTQSRLQETRCTA